MRKDYVGLEVILDLGNYQSHDPIVGSTKHPCYAKVWAVLAGPKQVMIASQFYVKKDGIDYPVKTKGEGTLLGIGLRAVQAAMHIHAEDDRPSDHQLVTMALDQGIFTAGDVELVRDVNSKPIRFVSLIVHPDAKQKLNTLELQG